MCTIPCVDAELQDNLAELLEIARREDVGPGDVTTSLMVGASQPARFALLAKSPCVLAGCECADVVLRTFDADLKMSWCSGVGDGNCFTETPTTLATIDGTLASLLAVERTLLNFLQRMCGVATLTRAFVDAIAGTHSAIYDTRKTIPGWRKIDKYAVRCGGGRNHREGLFDAVLIKDNHLAGVETRRLAGYVFDMLNRLAEVGRKVAFVEVEADSLEQVEALFSVMGIDVILLDNFGVEQLRAAVELRDDFGLRGKVALEASGGVNLSTVRAIAETGVERISVGAITHSAAAVDLSMERV